MEGKVIEEGINSDDGQLYRCTCGSEILAIEFETDPKWQEDCYCDVSIWRCGDRHIGWLYRLRMIWRILTIGHPYTDNVCMDKKQFKQFREYILKHEVEA